MAQIARKHLAKEAARKQAEKGSKATARRYATIHDERIPKRAPGAYAMFIQSRFNKTDGKSAVEAMQDLARAWKELDESEKRPFIELANSETERASKVRAELKEKAIEYWVEHSTVTPSRAKSDLQRIG
jgi:tRNA(Ile2) C34 agmatinyltransferase TiaS